MKQAFLQVGTTKQTGSAVLFVPNTFLQESLSHLFTSKLYFYEDSITLSGVNVNRRAVM